MFDWFKRRKETPAAVGKASQLEDGIRDQFTLQEAEKAYTELAELANANPQHPDIRRLQANAALNLLRLRPEDRTAEDKALLEGVQRLADLHPSEGILRECLVHLNWEYMADLPPDRLGESAAIHSRQVDLYTSHAEVRRHADAVIRTKMKLMTDYLIVGNIETARQLYDDILTFANQHMKEREVQIVRCLSAHNLIHRLTTVDDMGAEELNLARGYHQALEKFAARYSFKEDVAEYVAATEELVREEEQTS